MITGRGRSACTVMNRFTVSIVARFRRESLSRFDRKVGTPVMIVNASIVSG